MINIFRLVALLEGLSYVFLLFIAVPIKYWDGDEKWVKLLGMPHGILFVSYVIFAFLMKENKKWGMKDLGIVLLASILPFDLLFVVALGVFSFEG